MRAFHLIYIVVFLVAGALPRFIKRRACRSNSRHWGGEEALKKLAPLVALDVEFPAAR